MNKELNKLSSFTIGLVAFVIALSTPQISSAIALEMDWPLFKGLGVYWTIFMSFGILLLAGCFIKLSEGATNLGCLIGILVYASIYTQDLSTMIFIYGVSSFIPLVFGLLGFKLGITARLKLT